MGRESKRLTDMKVKLEVDKRHDIVVRCCNPEAMSKIFFSVKMLVKFLPAKYQI